LVGRLFDDVISSGVLTEYRMMSLCTTKLNGLGQGILATFALKTEGYLNRPIGRYSSRWLLQ